MVVINQLLKLSSVHPLLPYTNFAVLPKCSYQILRNILGITFDATQKVFLIRILLRVELFIQEISLLVVAIEGFDAPLEFKREGDA